MTRVLVVGNCQARPLASLFGQIENIHVIPPIILHLARAEEQEAHEMKLAEADVIVAQATAPNFQPGHLRSLQLKETHSGKVLVWPNVFFAGQQPHLCYVSTPGWRCMGPMESNHDLRTLRDWFHERHGRDFAAWIEQPNFTERVAQQSLLELQTREAECDVTVSDLIAEEYCRRRLFFLFNHPVLWLLTRLANRILEKIEHRHRLSDPGAGTSEPLGRYIPPGPEPQAGEFYLGSDVTLSDDGRVVPGTHHRYNLTELRQAFLYCYDHQQEALLAGQLRLTPNSGAYMAASSA